MKLLNFNKVLCLSPHPDDVEYSMLGTILKMNETHFDILCLTKGGKFDETTGNNRIDEVKRVWHGIENVELHFINDVYNFDDFIHEKWVNYIEQNFINKSVYDCVMIPTKDDSHIEHIKTNNIVFPLLRFKSSSIIEYKTPSTLNNWIPNFFVNINDFYDTKKTLLKYFKTQSYKWYFEENLLRSFHSNYLIHKKGIKTIESFRIVDLTIIS